MRKAWVMKQPFEKLVERHRGGTVGRHVDVSELIERYPRLFHLAEASSAPAISEHGLLPAKEIVSILTDMTAWQWLSALNERGFFWLHLQRPDQLLNARRNRGRPHDILVIDTASMVSARHRRIRLPTINSGSALYPNAQERGTRTSQTIEDYPFAERIRRRAPGRRG